MRSLRQVIVPRELLGRVTASWRLGGKAVTFAGALLAGTTAAAMGNDPRPVFAVAGSLALLTVTVAPTSGPQRAQHQESCHTKIIYRATGQLAALFAESGQTACLRPLSS
jgi:hypothetical protein